MILNFLNNADMNKKKILIFALIAAVVLAIAYFIYNSYHKKASDKKVASIGSNFTMVAEKENNSSELESATLPNSEGLINSENSVN